MISAQKRYRLNLLFFWVVIAWQTFTYLSDPFITAIQPAFGPAAGGTVVTIFGTSFINSVDLACRFGSLLTMAFWLDSTKIRCLVPQNSNATEEAFAVQLSVNIQEQEYSGNSVSFVYQPQLFVNTIGPMASDVQGGSTITITGSNFDPLRTLCRFGLETVPASFHSSSEIHCISPPNTIGSKTLAVSVNNGHDWLETPHDFDVFDRLQVISRRPAFGSSTGGTNVVLSILGNGLGDSNNSYACRFGLGPSGAQAVVNGTIHQSGEVTCKTPAWDDEMVTVEIESLGDAPAISESGLRYEFTDLPHVDLFAPAEAPCTGGIEITINGHDFVNREGLACSFGGIIQPATFYTANQIRCRSPRRVPGPVILEITMNGQDFTNSGKIFTFYAGANVMSINPSNGPPTGGSVVTVAGNFFRDSPSLVCRFGDIVVPVLRYASVTEIVCISPPQHNHRSDTVFLEVSNNNFTFSSNLFSFEYHPKVEVQTLNPTHAPSIQPQTEVVVTGINFRPTQNLSCIIDGNILPAKYLSPSQLLCNVPSHASGEFPLEISLNGQDFSVSNVLFSYDTPVSVTAVWPVLGAAAIGGTVVSVNGTGFLQTTDLSCRFGNTVVAASFISDSRLICESPPGLPGLVALEVSNNRRDFSTSGNGFLYVADPSIYAINPRKGPATGQYPVYVVGNNFVNTTSLRCRFDRWVVHATFISPRVVVCMAPQRFAGPSEFAAQVVVDVSIRKNDKLILGFITLMTVVCIWQVSVNGLDYTDDRVVFDYYDRCLEGYYCPGLLPLPCPNGTYCSGKNNFNFTLCYPGSFQPQSGSWSCLPCPVGYVCPDFGMSKPLLCPAGYVCDKQGLRMPVTPCPPGHFCLAGKWSS